MNIIFGTSSGDKGLVRELTDSAEKYFKLQTAKPSKKLVKSDSISLLVSSLKNKTLGFARNKDVSVVLYGFVYAPTPEWDSFSDKKSPLDEPRETAEFLLKRYLKYGKNFTKDIYGHYIAIVYDNKTSQMLVARDPHGQNDLFYFEGANGIVFSNRLRCITESLGSKVELDRSYEDFFLTFGFYPNNKTMYKSITALPKQSVLVIKNAKALVHEIAFKKDPVDPISDEDELIDVLHKKLKAATKNLLPTKKQKCAVLLGGFDSALVASLIAREGYEVETFSFHYADESYNQAHTQTVAKYLGIKHNWIPIDESVIEEGLRNFSDVFNRPTNWPSYVIQTEFLCKEIAKRGFSYCYTGDGCDALFQGYPLTFKRAQVLDRIGNILPAKSLSLLTKAAERPLLEKSLGRPYQVGLGLLRTTQLPKDVRAMLGFRIFDPVSIKQLRTDEAPKQKPINQTALTATKAHRGKSSAVLSYEGKKAVSPNKNKLNGSSDSSGLVIASPYMHHSVSHFAQNIPEELLRPKGTNQPITGKYILSKMAQTKKLLPDSVIYQPKIGAADSPIEEWYESSFDSLISEQLDQLPFLYDKSYVKRLKKRGRAEKLYGKLLARSTNGVITLSHCISLLMTYASFTKSHEQK